MTTRAATSQSLVYTFAAIPLAVVLVLRTRLPMLKSVPSATLLWLTVAVAALTLAIPYAGSLAAAFCDYSCWF